jgi:hypothetical protein
VNPRLECWAGSAKLKMDLSDTVAGAGQVPSTGWCVRRRRIGRTAPTAVGEGDYPSEPSGTRTARRRPRFEPADRVPYVTSCRGEQLLASTIGVVNRSSEFCRRSPLRRFGEIRGA